MYFGELVVGAAHWPEGSSRLPASQRMVTERREIGLSVMVALTVTCQEEPAGSSRPSPGKAAATRSYLA